MEIKKTVSSFLTLVALLTVSYNASAQRIINCSPNPSPEDLGSANQCLMDALENAQPGDEIILAPGNYRGGTRSVEPFDNFSSFASDADGTASQPIIIRGSSATNKPVITTSAGREHGWYGLSITGDYWIIKDIKVTNVAKGVVLDHANNCQLIGLTVTDIGEEAIHLRSGSSNNLIQNCEISYTGQIEGKEGFGEAVYVGSDRKRHSSIPGDLNDPNCNNNIIENSIIGPFITADAFDIKEGTENTVIRGNTFYAEGVTGINSADSFIDLKGTYGYVYDNIFNINPENDPNKDVSQLNAVIDVSNRTFGGYDYKTGEFSAIFDNTINIADSKSDIPTTRIILDPEKQPEPSTDVHVYNNTRVPDSEWVLDPVSSEVISFSCPEWNEYRPCTVLSVATHENNPKVTFIQNTNTKTVSIIGLLGNSKTKISIFDLTGKNIKNITTTDLVVTINTSNFSSGVYVFTINSGNSAASKLLIL